MPHEVPQADRLRAAVIDKYRGVAKSPEGLFAYPTGAAGARQLAYREQQLARIPAAVLERFVGVGNPLGVRPALPGERVLDVGCGAGLDSFLAAEQVGAGGRVVGLDLTPEMIAIAHEALARAKLAQLRFEVGSAEALPFEDASFDLMISNGALNLVVDKQRCFGELLRVLRPGGALSIADLLVIESIPDEVLADMDAWST